MAPAVVGGVMLVAAGFAVVQPLVSRPDDGPRVVHDAGFAAAAVQQCRDSLPGLRPPTTKTKGETLSPGAAADAVDRAATGIESLAARLRSLPVAAPEAPAVQGWLDHWARYVDVGRRYASTLRSGDVGMAQKVAKEGTQPQLQADRFARANGMSDCQFYVLLKPSDRGDRVF